MSRAKQRANRRKKDQEIRMGLRPARKEEMLDIVDSFGIKDPTPYEAMKNMMKKGA